MTIVVGTNSYISLSDATNYFNESLAYGAIWPTLDPVTQEQALVTAARMLDRQTWQGSITDPITPQMMQWPRINVVDKYGNAVPSNAVPQNIINGQCELAMAIYSNPTVETQQDTTFNIKSLKAGPADIDFFRPINGGRFPTVVAELVSQYMSGATPIPFVSGNNKTSRFDPDCPENNYGVVRGFS